MVNGLINALAEAEHWLPGDGPPPLDHLLARPMLLGLRADPPASPAPPGPRIETTAA